MKAKIFVFIYLFSAGVSYGQTDAVTIINGLIQKFQLVKTYQADAVIKPEISFLKILPQKANIYFRQPDQFRIKSTGISILPKQQFDNVFSLLIKKDSYIPVLTGKETFDNLSLSVVNIIPLGDTSELIMAKLWVDDNKMLIHKAQLTTRANGTIEVNYKHGKYANFGLPDVITFIVDIKKFKVPKAIAADINTTSMSEKESANQPKKGKITVTVSNYIINKSLPDNIFNSK